MAELNQIYSCKICGNVVKVIHAGFGQLVCCGENMVLKETEKNSSSNETFNDSQAQK